MKPRTRDALILVAGLPGVATPFLPFETVWGFSPCSLLDNVSLHDVGQVVRGLAFAVSVFLPIVVTIWQARRWWLGEPVSWERRLFSCFAAISLVLVSAFQVAEIVAEIFGSEIDGIGYSLLWLVLLLLLVAGNVALLVLNRRRRIATGDVVECFLLGSYVAFVVPFLFMFVSDLDVGGMLAAWTCVVYAATIVVRARNRPDTGTVT